MVVVLWGDQQRRELSPERSQRLCNHSPDGFQWGYAGSGPAQLALALLLDHTGKKEFSLANYQAFKYEVVARMPGEFKLTDSEINLWLKLPEAERQKYFQRKWDGVKEEKR